MRIPVADSTMDINTYASITGHHREAVSCTVMTGT